MKVIRKNLKLIKTTITQHHSNRTLTTRPRYGIRPNCIKPRSASGATSNNRELTSFGSQSFCLTLGLRLTRVWAYPTPLEGSKQGRYAVSSA